MESKLKIDIRRHKIVEHLHREGKLTVSQLSQMLDVTPVTIRTDLAALEREGYLIRMRGGAVLSTRPQTNMGAEEDEQSYLQKQALAAEAAALIKDGQTLFFNSGTTTHHIARALHGKRYLNIVTNSLAVAMELGNTPTFHVLLLGGDIDSTYGFTHGGDTQDQLCKYRADWAILSVDGVSAKGGLTTYHSEESIIDRLMIANAKNTMVVVTGNKIGNVGFSRICDCNAKLVLITDQTCDADALQLLKEKNVQTIAK